MWKSFLWTSNTLTGLPSPAQMPLKFTPAAITCTSTSPGPGSGVGMTSFWKDCLGGPWRSRRMTQACMWDGTTPSSGT